MEMKKIYEFSGEHSSTCEHSWIKIKNGYGSHSMCIKCGKVRISSGIIPTVTETPIVHKYKVD